MYKIRIPQQARPVGQMSWNSASGRLFQISRSSAAQIALFASLVLLTACATATKPADNNTKLSAAQQLEQDMVRELIAVVPEVLEPLHTTIQYNKTISGSVDDAVLMLVDLGYGLQRVDADQGKYFLRLNDITSELDTSNNEKRLRLALGPIELTRSYRVISSKTKVDQDAQFNWRSNKSIIASGPLLVAGTRQPMSIGGYEIAPTNNDDDAEQLALVAGSVEYISSAPIKGGIPSISLITDELVQQVATAAFPGSGLGQLYVDSFNLNSMTHIFDEAFASVSDNYERVARQTVIFPNDSQFLGRPGKLQVKKLLGRYSGNTDLVGIVGCSNGPTRLEIGNEGLALGRAKRIAEEFYTAGLPRDKVFNEGCWSDEVDVEGFPNRGVVIDLWRRKV